MNNFKGYVYTIFSGVLLAAGVLFVALQWALKSDLNIYGYPFHEANTALLVLLSALGGVLAFWLIRVLIRGVRILRKVRSEQKRIAAAASKASEKSAAPAAKDDKAKDDSDSPLGPR